MKPLKKAKQKNVEIDRNYYTEAQYAALASIEGVGTIEHFDGEDTKLRVFFENVVDIKVVLDECGDYCTVCVMNSGETIHVSLQQAKASGEPEIPASYFAKDKVVNKCNMQLFK